MLDEDNRNENNEEKSTEEAVETTEGDTEEDGDEGKKSSNRKNNSERNDLNIIYDVPVNISAVVGCAKIKVSQLLKLGRGAIIELDKKVGDPVDIYVNNRIVAMGEIVVVNGNIGITMTEIIKMNV